MSFEVEELIKLGFKCVTTHELHVIDAYRLQKGKHTFFYQVGDDVMMWNQKVLRCDISVLKQLFQAIDKYYAAENGVMYFYEKYTNY